MELAELIDRVEADAAQQPERDALMANIYATLDDPRIAESFGAIFVEQDD